MDGSNSGPLASTLQELGEALRKIRASRTLTLRQVEVLQQDIRQEDHPDLKFVSRSVLSRYENGKKLPSPGEAGMLDRIYGCRSWIALSVTALTQSVWSPWDADWPAEEHCYAWPADYSGPVWIRLKPTPHEVAAEHDIRLSWGPWAWQGKLLCPPAGIYLVTNKAGGEVPLSVRTAPHAYCQFGVGKSTGDGDALDINHEWFEYSSGN